MRALQLGRSGVTVSSACLGTMAFGTSIDRAQAAFMLDAFSDLGGTFLDTGAVFGDGASDDVLRSVLRGRRFVISAKFGRALGPHGSGPTVENLRASLDATLRALGVEVIDLLLVHGWAGFPALEEVSAALEEALRSGKVRAVGVADAPAWAMAHLNGLGTRSGVFRIDAALMEYGLAARDAERELLPMAAVFELTAMAWGTTAGELLLGRDASSGYYQRVRAASATQLEPVITRTAAELGVSREAVVLGWLSAAAPQVVPVLGATTAAEVSARVKALSNPLPSQHVNALSQASSIALGFPHEYLADEDVRRELGRARDLQPVRE